VEELLKLVYKRKFNDYSTFGFRNELQLPALCMFQASKDRLDHFLAQRGRMRRNLD